MRACGLSMRPASVLPAQRADVRAAGGAPGREPPPSGSWAGVAAPACAGSAATARGRGAAECGAPARCARRRARPSAAARPSGWPASTATPRGVGRNSLQGLARRSLHDRRRVAPRRVGPGPGGGAVAGPGARGRWTVTQPERAATATVTRSVAVVVVRCTPATLLARPAGWWTDRRGGPRTGDVRPPSRAPPVRWVTSLAGGAVDRLPDQVRVAVVPGVLLDHVRVDPAQGARLGVQ